MNKWFAHGNILLIITQIWTLWQALMMSMLVWDVPFYLYDLRVLRWINFGIAILYVACYLFLIILDVNLIGFVDEWKQKDLIFNYLLETILSYSIIQFIPTFLVNFQIVLKEITMN